jgi:VanZ family protein
LRTAVSSSLWRYWAPPVIWSLTIVVLSGNIASLPSTFSGFKWLVSLIVTVDPGTLAPIHFYFRKVLHVICYGILTVLWFRALMASQPEHVWTNRILALGLCLMVALADEGRQYFYPSRTSTWWDVCLDMSGGVLFVFLSALFFKKNMAVPVEEQPAFPFQPSPGPSILQSQKRRFIFKK